MGMNTRLSPELIARLQALCKQATEREEGIRLNFSSPYEATKFRMRIYIARRALRRINSDDSSPICMVEMKLEGKSLLLFEQASSLADVEVLDAATGERLNPLPADFSAARKIMLEISAADRMELELLIAETLTRDLYPTDIKDKDSLAFAEAKTKELADKFVLFGWNATITNVEAFAAEHNIT